MASFTGPLKPTQVVLGELRWTSIGPSQGINARFALADIAGTTYAMTNLRVFSPRTHTLLQRLRESMEADAVEAFCVQTEESATEPAGEESTGEGGQFQG